MLAPMAPHFASELWSGFQSAPNRLSDKEYDYNKSVLEQCWPEVDQEYCLDLVCQTNGVDNAILKIPRWKLEKMDYDTAVKLALDQPEIKEQLSVREMIDIKFNIFTGYEGVVNILTKDKPKEEVVNIS